MSPCDLPVWVLRLGYSQARARYDAGLFPYEYWRCYAKAWSRRYARDPVLKRKKKGPNYVSRDLSRPVVDPRPPAEPG